MNQIPNIEEIKKILPCIDPQCDNQGTTITVNSDGEPEQMQCEYCYRERFPILDYFHHQLQKARQDWLREEIVRLEGMLSRWVAAYMPADEGKDPSKWGFKTEKEAWDFIEKRLTPCPLDPRDKSGEPCDSCMAEWMVYQIPEVDQALQTIIDCYQAELYQDKK